MSPTCRYVHFRWMHFPEICITPDFDTFPLVPISYPLFVLSHNDTRYVTPSTIPFFPCLLSQCILAVGSGLAGKVVSSFSSFSGQFFFLRFFMFCHFVSEWPPSSCYPLPYWFYMVVVVVVWLSCSLVSRFRCPIYPMIFQFRSLISAFGLWL